MLRPSLSLFQRDGVFGGQNSGITSELIETNVNIFVNFVWVRKSFQTHIKLPVKCITMGLVGFSDPHKK